jgi:phosphoribosylaminoimidazole-succinocarboxamide synthase
MRDVRAAKQLAIDVFLWLEERFARARLHLIDLCLFVDRSGHVVFGEISPDCMRVRSEGADGAAAFDKDVWRSGGTPEAVALSYNRLHQRITPVL